MSVDVTKRVVIFYLTWSTSNDRLLYTSDLSDSNVDVALFDEQFQRARDIKLLYALTRI